MPKANRAFPDLARRRMQLVGQRTSQIVSIEKSTAQHMGATISGNSVRELTHLTLAGICDKGVKQIASMV